MKRLWRHGADAIDVDALAQECCDLLHKRLEAISIDGICEGDKSPGIADVTLAIKRHFLVCETTREARLARRN